MTTEPESSFIALMRAEMKSAMSELKVDLIDRFAGKKDVEDLNRRVDLLEKDRDGAAALSTWQRWMIGGVMFAAINAAIYVTLYHYIR